MTAAAVRRGFPVVATLVVLAAVAAMVALGVWQLHRKAWKEGLLARYAENVTLTADAPWPNTPAAREAALFRHATLDCLAAVPASPSAGHNAQGETGWAQIATCSLAGGEKADVVLGWTNDPQARTDWRGGPVRGIIAPGASGAVRLIAMPPLAGLQPNGAPDPANIPNNHLSYAVQWFLFAATALVIYALALRKRLRE